MRTTYQKGFTVLLAALVSSLVLSLGLSIAVIVRKSIRLSSVGRDSQIAFYAADSGAECALYWDIRHNYFTPTPPPDVFPECENVPLNAIWSSDTLPYFAYFEFEPNGECARITVNKADVHPRTVIRADGFSVPCDQIEDSDRALQRSIELIY